MPGCVTYGGHRTTGLSNGRHDILRDVVNTARATKEHQAAEAADELIGRQAREGCRERYRTGSPSSRAWQ